MQPFLRLKLETLKMVIRDGVLGAFTDAFPREPDSLV